MRNTFKRIIVGSAFTFLVGSYFAGTAIADYATQPMTANVDVRYYQEQIEAVADVKDRFLRISNLSDMGITQAVPSIDTSTHRHRYKKNMPEIPHLLMGGGSWGQEIYRYSDAPGGSVMVSSGCGPAALSMILEGYGVQASPLDVANWLADHGGHSTAGTAGSSLMQAARAFGIPMSKVDYSKAEIVAALQNGRAIIAGHGGDFSKPLFAAPGGSGHFVVYKGISPDGRMLYVNDPNDYDNEKHVYDIDTVLAEQPDIYVVL